MSTWLRNLAVALAITAILLSCIQPNTHLAFSSSSTRKIDLFTQKRPFDGKGPNMTSDAFGPEEEVVIYALVTYNDYPVSSAQIAFEIHGPSNPMQNITLFNYGQTNESGIARISFRIGLRTEITFGEWAAIGSVFLAGEVSLDFLFFRVGWIVEMVSIKTLNESHVEQTSFMRNSAVGIELAVRSISMSEKTATLAITLYDNMSRLINSTEINDFRVPPNETLVYSYSSLFIPESAFAGEATVDTCAYTALVSSGGVPYSPKVSKHFLIAGRDIAILDVQPSPEIVNRGETVNVDVNVKNEGEGIESFIVTSYYNGTLMGTLPVIGLKPHLNTTIRFAWNTSTVTKGFYELSAYAEPVPNEIDISDNSFTDGIIEVRSSIHDIAVSNVTCLSSQVYIGETLDINVTVKNEGNQVESFNVTALANSVAIETSLVQNLGAGAERMIVFSWDTSHVPEGDYMLSALASYVPGEVDYENNRHVDGTVRVAAAPRREFVPDWFYWFLLLLLLILIGILLSAWLYRRRKKSEVAFYSGWTAWYYCYDLRDKTCVE